MSSTTKGAPVKGAQNTNTNPPNAATATTNNNNNKKAKSESKSDKADLSHPKIQATAEQMQIAKIMDSHRAEDPELQKKIRQVMEITRTTEDQACMALHSREYDIEQAITLLTDGGSQSLEQEWEQAGKKRKGKQNANQKAEVTASKDIIIKGAKDAGRDKSEKRDPKAEKKDIETGGGGGDQASIGLDQKRNDRGGRGGPGTRGRGGRPGPVAVRGGRNDKENEESKPGRLANGPLRGRGGFVGRGGRGGGRTFASRARGERESDSYNTIDVWEPEGAKETPLKVDKWGEFPSAEDWDNEEYTGSLADTKVFTPSTQPSQGPLSDSTNSSGHPNSNHIQNASNKPGGQESGVTLSSVVQGLAGSGSAVQAGQSLDLNMLLSKQNTATGTGVSAHQNAGVNLLASLQSSYSNSNQALPQRNKVQRPRGPSSKIPSSAVEMPGEPATTTLDVQFGGMDLNSDASLSFSSVIQGGKSSIDNSWTGAKLDSFVTGSNDKDLKPTGHSASSFQPPINAQSQVPMDSGKGSNVTSNLPPGIESLSSLSQSQSKPQAGPNSFGATVNTGSGTGSAFVSYGATGKPAPGFSAPGFPPVSQTGTYGASAAAPMAGGVPPYGVMPSQQPSGYLGYCNPSANLPNQPIVASTQGTNVPYPGSNAGPPNYQSINTGYSAGSNSQYGNYGPKMTGVSSSGIKDPTTDVNVSTAAGSSVTGQMGTNIQSGSVNPSTSSSTGKAPVPGSTTTNVTSKMSSGIPPGMVMPATPYVLSQNTQAMPFYGMQTQVYGYDDNAMQFLPRFPPNLGYYDANSAGYGVVAAAPGGRNDAAMPAYSTTGDGRFQRSDSSTGSPVPSNLQAGNTQQAVYNPGMPYFYNYQGSHYYPQVYQAPMAAATNTSGAPHAPTANHQYSKNMYNAAQYFDNSQGGPGNDFGKNSYSSGSVGPSGNSNKGPSASASGVSQSTDLNSSMYSNKGHKMNSYDNKYGTGQGGYGSHGAQQPNVLSNLNSGMGPYGVYIPQAEAGSGSRSGPGQQKGNKQPYGGGGGGPYWGNN